MLRRTIFVFLITGLFLQSCFSETKITSEQIAPDFVLEDLSGKKVALKDLRGRVVLLSFFTTWCLYCVKEIPELVQLNNKYSDCGLVILGVNIQEPKDKVMKFILKKNINYSVLLDSNGKVANMYNVRGIPTNVLIDKNGVVQYYAHTLPNENLIKSLFPEKLLEKKIQLKVGDRAPFFSLLNIINNNKVSLKEYLNSKSVIVWFTDLCGDCQRNIPDLEALYNKYKKSIEILAISQLGSDTKAVKKVINKLKPTFTFLIDPDGDVCKLYIGKYLPNICSLNNIYFIDKDGILREISHYPGLSKKELEKKIKFLVSSDFGKRDF